MVATENYLKMDCQWIEMAALGRPLFTGMLYDCRNDSYIPGVTLWDSDALKKDLDTRFKPNSIFNISTSDSISAKTKLLEISSSLKASILGGLVEVCGSAKYLKDQTSSMLQSRVTMQYSQTVRFEQLTMTHLGQVKYTKVFEQKSATHVVAAVLYGAQAFFVFDKQVQSAEIKHKIDVKLSSLLRKVPQVSLDGDVVNTFTANEKEELKTFNCTFYGDYQLKNLPTKFEDAVQVFNMLPTMLGEKGELAVPIRVWLMPLATLEPLAARLEQTISSISISEAEAAVEGLDNALKQCNDLLKDPLLNQIGYIPEQVTKVQQLLCHYEASFRHKLAELLQAVRGGELEESALKEALQAHLASPFNGQRVQHWLGEKHSEAKVLELYVRSLSRMTTVCSAKQLAEFRLDPQKETVISFSFTSVDCDVPYLKQLKAYLDHHGHAPESTTVNGSEQKPWFCCSTISKGMREQLRIFMELMEANRGGAVRFITCVLSDTSQPGANIHFFHHGILMVPLALNPPKPAVVEDLQRSTATLLLPEPPAGALRYRLELAELEGHPDKQPGLNQHKWISTETQGTPNTWTFSDLNPRRVYLFRYRVVTQLIVGLASKVTQFQTKGYFH